MEGGVRVSSPEITLGAGGCKAGHRNHICEKQVPSKGCSSEAPQSPQCFCAKSEHRLTSPGRQGCRVGKGKLLPSKRPATATHHRGEHVAERERVMTCEAGQKQGQTHRAQKRPP